MGRRMRLFLVLILISTLGDAGVAAAAIGPADAGAVSPTNWGICYNCTLAVEALSDAEDGAALAELEWDGHGNSTRLTLARDGVTVAMVRGGQVSRTWRVLDGALRPFTVMRRGDWLGVARGDAIIFRGNIPRAPGKQGGITTPRGWRVRQRDVRKREPVIFADNFMRTAEESGGWAIASGKWALQSAWDADPRGNRQRFSYSSYSTNPFAWCGANPEGQALCTAGRRDWDGYTLNVAMRPAAGGAAGVAVNIDDETHGLLVRWTPASPRGEIALYRLDGRTRTLLARDPGGYLPGQWYRLTVISDFTDIRVLVDGRERLMAQHITPWYGRIGLYTEGRARTIFDDLTVYGRGVNTDLIAESRLSRISTRIREDIEMQQWINDWQVIRNDAMMREYNYPVSDHCRLALGVSPRSGRPGELCLTLNAGTDADTSGYRAHDCARHRRSDELSAVSRYGVTGATTWSNHEER